MNLEQRGNVLYKDGAPFAVLNTESDAKNLFSLLSVLNHIETFENAPPHALVSIVLSTKKLLK